MTLVLVTPVKCRHCLSVGGSTATRLPDWNLKSRKAAFVISSSKNLRWSSTVQAAFSGQATLRNDSFLGVQICTVWFGCTVAGYSCKLGCLWSNRPQRFLQNVTVLAAGEGGSNVESVAGLNRVQSLETHPQFSARGEGTSEATLDWRLFVSEREATKVVLYRFLRTRGLSHAAGTHTVNKASLFVAHLLSLVHSHYGQQYLSGVELSTDEIRGVVRPYLRTLAAKYGKGLADALVVFPNVPPSSRLGGQVLYNIITNKESGQEKVTQVNLSNYPTILGLCGEGEVPPSVAYFLSMGMSLEQIEEVLTRSPLIVGYNLETRIKRVVEYVIEMGVSPSSIPTILRKRPTLFGCSVEENLRPTATFLEGLGVPKERWAKIMVAFPHILTYSQAKLQDIVDFLLENGFCSYSVGLIITRFPHIVGYSLEAKIKPIFMYFRRIGIVDVSAMLMRSPQVLGLSLEGNIKTTVGFLVGLGFTSEEVATIVNRFPQILGLSVENNLLPKWEYFVSMDRPKSELVHFPQYFGYSLKKRIEPRHHVLLGKGLLWKLNRMLTTTDNYFERHLQKTEQAVLNATKS